MPEKSLDHPYLRGSMLLLGLTLLILLIITGLFVREARIIIAAEAEQQHLNALIPPLRRALESFLDAETGQRGFLISGDSVYLQPYQRARRNIGEHLAMARAGASAGDTFQQTSLDRLEVLAGLKFAELEQTIELTRAGRRPEAIALLRSHAGKATMDEARHILEQMITVLGSERTAISETIQRALYNAQIFMLITAVAMICSVALAIRLLVRILHDNDQLNDVLAREAAHDVLTGLPNRRMLYEVLPTFVEQARRRHSSVAVLYIDLDGFKTINDNLGHAAGDQVLKLVAERASAILRRSDVLARLGGDEFAIAVTHTESPGDLRLLAHRFLQAISPPLPDALAPYTIGASIGIAIFPDHGTSLDDIMRAADSAMYQAKRAGKGGVCFAGAV